MNVFRRVKLLSLCFTVPGHQIFEDVPYGKQLKINLILNSSLVHLYYTRNNDPTEHLLLDKGEFTNASGTFSLLRSTEIASSVHCLFNFPFDFRPEPTWVWMTVSLWRVQWYFWTGSAEPMLDCSK